MPEAFLARFPVAAYVLYRQAARCVGLRPTRLGLRPISPDVSEKKTSGTQGNSTAVLNPFAFVTVLVFTKSEQYDPLKDQTKLKSVKSGRRMLFVSKNILMLTIRSRYPSRSF